MEIAENLKVEDSALFKNNEVELMRNKIEGMDKYNQIQVLKILNKNKVTLNENNNGVFINLSNLNNDVLSKLNDYIIYVETQERNLSCIENKKDDYLNKYFTKDIKISNNIYVGNES
jgi:aspartate/tyrosine/aromatic aminotransferase